MTTLQNKRILLGITGSIAAYKTPELIRLLKEQGAEVRVILSAGGESFVTPLTLQALSQNPVFTKLLDVDSEAAMSHIALARWADLLLIAPATAHVIAKLTAGFADDLLTTACLATHAPIIIAPAMNVAMWTNEVTQENVKKLQNRKIHFIGPETGIQACGETGEGRMSEPAEIVTSIAKYYSQQRLKGKKIIVTAGPTQEALDPVRYLTNHSSGKMGYALAKSAAQEGADVIMVSGPTALPTPQNVKRIDVRSSEEMFNAVMAHLNHCDIFIGAAAVSDYKFKYVNPQKIKKSNNSLSIELEKNPDILLSVSQAKNRSVTVGFAAETENLIENAKRKFKEKNLDILIANQVGKQKGFHSDYNEVFVMTAQQSNLIKLPYAKKEVIANNIMEIIINYLNPTQSSIPVKLDQEQLREITVL